MTPEEQPVQAPDPTPSDPAPYVVELTPEQLAAILPSLMAGGKIFPVAFDGLGNVPPTPPAEESTSAPAPTAPPSGWKAWRLWYWLAEKIPAVMVRAVLFRAWAEADHPQRFGAVMAYWGPK